MTRLAKVKGFLQRHRQGARFATIVVVVCALTLAAVRGGQLDTAENLYYDVWHQLAGQRRVPQHVVLVAVDDQTLDEHKDDPLAFWQPYFGRAMGVLNQAGVKAIGLDYLYRVSAESWLKKLKLPDSEISRNYDAPFRAQLVTGNVVLIDNLTLAPKGDSIEIVLPPEDHLFMLPRVMNDVGLSNLHQDADGVVRHFFPALAPDPDQPLVGFATQLAVRAAGEDPTATQWKLGGADIARARDRRIIGYAGPPGTFPRISMSKLLTDNALFDPEVRALKGKVAIIADLHSGTQDIHATPYYRGFTHAQVSLMAGGEIHANIIETLLTGEHPRNLPEWLEILYLVAFVMLGTLIFLRLHPLWGVGAFGALAAVSAALAYFFFLKDWILPVGQIQAASLTAFLMTLGLRLTGEERQRAQLRKMFGRYVSDDVVNVLTAEGQRPDLSGEEVVVTVLFSDIRNFTTISEKLNAHEVVEMLNAYFSRTCEPILEQGGMVNKYIGDAVMAIFGSPVRHRDHARRAIAAALGMKQQADEFRQWMEQRFPERGLPEFAIGIGLHTGIAVIGDIGSVKRTEFTAIGDTVNAASRLEGVTKELKWPVVASQATVAAAGADVKTGGSQMVSVKGRAEAIEVFEILGLKSGVAERA